MVRVHPNMIAPVDWYSGDYQWYGGFGAWSMHQPDCAALVRIQLPTASEDQQFIIASQIFNAWWSMKDKKHPVFKSHGNIQFLQAMKIHWHRHWNIHWLIDINRSIFSSPLLLPGARCRKPPEFLGLLQLRWQPQRGHGRGAVWLTNHWEVTRIKPRKIKVLLDCDILLFFKNRDWRL